MNLVLFGGAGRTGRHVLDLALQAGHHVVAVVRRPEAVDADRDGLRVVVSDVLRPQQWAADVVGADAVVSTLGIGPGIRSTTVFSEGARAMLDAMDDAGVRRIAVVSAPPAEHRSDWGRYGALRSRVLFPILDRRFGVSYDDMRRMEAILRASDAEWTSYRPPYLSDSARRHPVRTAINAPVPGARRLSRTELAATMLAGLTDPTHVRAVVDLAR
ncbi:NAD(P)-dependent oxidoreductase [Microbacterium gorillae]|uniref:NAD(P)-dependent oxidoreductase n=1 Tax=Microbacterium gorillae TaxID=1231063 RepID=UPI00058F320E|nr:NAD(P)H-binding protein [Microbacterium gorillae]